MEMRPQRRPAGRFVLQRRVRWGECDPAGVVFTPRFADFVVEAHLAFFEHLFGAPTYELLKPMDLALPAKAISIEFKHSLWPDQLFEMSAEVAAIRTRTYELAVVGTALDGIDAFSGNLTLICLNRSLRKSQPLPEFIREKLEVSQHCSAGIGEDSILAPVSDSQ